LDDFGGFAAFDRQKGTVQPAPGDESPTGSMPQTSQQHGDHQIDVGALCAAAVAAEAYIEIVAQPARQRDVPAAPEIGKTQRGVRGVEVVIERKSQRERGPDGGVELWSKPADARPESALEDMPRLKYSDSWTATRRGIYYTQSATVGFYDFAARHAHVIRDLQQVPAPLGGLGISVSKDEHWLLYTRNAQWQGDIMLISGLR